MPLPHHTQPCTCAWCNRPESPPPALSALPGGAIPFNASHRFCLGCLAITEHDSAVDPRPNCLHCGTHYASGKALSGPARVLWQAAEAELLPLRKRPVKTGRIYVGFGEQTSDGCHPVEILAVVPHD